MKLGLLLKAVVLSLVVVVAIGGTMTYATISKYMAPVDPEVGFSCPAIHNPGPLEGILSWEKVFDPTYRSFDASGAEAVYGINIWQVDKSNLVRSIKNMVEQGGSGLIIARGQIHAVDIYPEEGDLFTVVFIFEWETGLTEENDNPNGWMQIPTLMRFYQMVEAYNWTMDSVLQEDLSAYAEMIDAPFHADLCNY